MPASADGWRPSAEFEKLRLRAQLFACIRHFFAERGVLEVETPLLSRHATVERHVESFSVAAADGTRWLQTSPEFAMKRLLAAGSGPIYQVARVFRREEAGRLHNPEFTMLEWYRPGFDHHRLMDEVEALLCAAGCEPTVPFERLSYRQALMRYAGVDPEQPAPLLREALAARLPVPPASEAEADDADFWLDLAMGMLVLPALGRPQPAFVYDFPPSQAALARVDGGVACRFELVWRGVELANGFHELCEANEQRRRFEADQAWRRRRGRTVPPYDTALIEALDAGLPDCAGVALGLDRLLMLLSGAAELASVLSFDWQRA